MKFIGLFFIALFSLALAAPAENDILKRPTKQPVTDPTIPALGGNANRAVSVEPVREKSVLVTLNVGISPDATAMRNSEAQGQLWTSTNLRLIFPLFSHKFEEAAEERSRRLELS
ncbi:hypothetical protein EMPG_15222 [Blastomyces silverae]|uniref:Uncharacterized protein n=1 Tax=Blastomyces silverae TaxID=2060906 RepID=A0A0H1BD53_9EURO|nr:hypothetical protein EMPG_15222 [Blastomyces silverae]